MATIETIQRIIISRYRQFEYFDLNLADPSSKETLRDICLIGQNGIGKSTILEQLRRASDSGFYSGERENAPDSLVLTKLVIDGEPLWQARVAHESFPVHWFTPEIESAEEWKKLKDDRPDLDTFAAVFENYKAEEPSELDASSLHVDPVDPLSVSTPGIELQGFLSQLQFDIDCGLEEYYFLPENRDRTIAEMEATYRKENPLPLPLFDDPWNDILGDLSLRFIPEEEEARFQSLVTGEDVPANSLSPALQRLLIQVADLVLWSKENSGSGILILDNPEEGLHPTTVLRAMKTYRSIIQGNPIQTFTATNSPLVATLYEASQRIRLSLDSGNRLTAETGIAPRGSNPNQIFSKDFNLPPLNGPKPPAPKSTRKRGSTTDQDDRDELEDLIDELMSY